MESTPEIRGIEFSIATSPQFKRDARGQLVMTRKGPKKTIWYIATWKCKSCGAGGQVGAFMQNTDMGTYQAAMGAAEMHVRQCHDPKPPAL
jgi:hypothetical protein